MWCLKSILIVTFSHSCRLLFLVVVLWAVHTSHADITEKIVEGAVWQLLKQAIIVEGHSEDYADCVIQVMKWTGVQDDVMGLNIVFNPEKTLKKLENKMDFADAVCSAGGPYVCIIGLFLAILAMYCCCRCCCRCFSGAEKPVIVRLDAGIPTSEVPYERFPVGRED